MTYPEGNDWQTVCRECSKKKCPKPEKVAEWMRALVPRLHASLAKTPVKPGVWSWKEQVAHYESLLEASMATWSEALRGVCPDCAEATESMDPADVHARAHARWRDLAPDLPGHEAEP